MLDTPALLPFSVPISQLLARITIDPAICHGKPVIRGTRLAVEFVLGLIAQGWPEPEITRNYRLTSEQIRACAAYAQARLNEEKVFAVGG